MALSVESSSSGTPATSGTSVTWSHTVTAATVLGVKAGAGHPTLASRSVSSATYNAVAMTSKGASDDANFLRIETLVIDTTSITGAHNVVVNWASASSTIMSPGATGFIGADVASFGTYAAAHANTNAPAVTVVSATGEIVFAGVASDSNTTITETGTLQWEREAIGGDVCCGAQTVNGAASVNATWAAGTPDTGWAADGISIKPAGGGGGGSTLGSHFYRQVAGM